MAVGSQRQAPAGLSPKKRPCTGLKGDWVGPMPGLAWVRKNSPSPEIDRGNVQPIASRYGLHVVPAHPSSVLYVFPNCKMTEKDV